VRLPVTALLLLVLATAAGCGDSGEPSRPPAANEVVMTDYDFAPSDVTVRPGTELTVRNEGQVAHNLTVEREGKRLIGTDSLIAKQSEGLKVEVPPGRYEMVCTLPGHEQQGMVGSIVVEQDGP
jgi:plastocyanin